MTKVALALMVGAFVSSQAHGQEHIVKVPSGTVIKVRLTQAVSSRTAHAGDTVACEVAEDVTVDGFLIAKKGAPVVGSVIQAHRARHLGQGAKLAVDIQKAQAADSQWLAVHAAQASDGKNAKPNVAAGTAFLVIFGGAPGLLYLLKHGKETELPAGTMANTTTVVDQQIAGASIAPPPVQPVP